VALYGTAAAFIGPLPDWINATDGARLATYSFYKALFKNDNTSFKITLREDEENPVYVPSAKRIVRTMARYTCKGLGFTTEGATPEAAAEMVIAFGDLFKREEFFPNFRDALEMGVAQGDFCCMVSGDIDKPELSRLSLRFIDPGTYFPLTVVGDRTRVNGQMLVETITMNEAYVENGPGTLKEYLRVQRWLKVTHPDHPLYVEPAPGVAVNYEVPIQYERLVMETRDWEDLTKRVIVKTEQPLVEIPGILTLPIYHFRNRGEVGELMGISELEGIERLFMGINQAATDEDVALAMQGLGIYVSNQRPVNNDGEPTDWVLGPRRVVQLSGTDGSFERVSGVSSVVASQDHIKYLQDMAESTVGISDVALGQVDTQTAESGIALALRMGPILDESTRKDERILSKLTQMFHDLKVWFDVYEGQTFDELVDIIPTVEPKLPVDTDKQITRLQDLYVNGVIGTILYITKLNELGMELGKPEDVMKAQMEEAAERAAAAAEQMAASGGLDPDGERLASEAEAPADPEE